MDCPGAGDCQNATTVRKPEWVGGGSICDLLAADR
jgi:hypothetical protein